MAGGWPQGNGRVGVMGKYATLAFELRPLEAHLEPFELGSLEALALHHSPAMQSSQWEKNDKVLRGCQCCERAAHATCLELPEVLVFVLLVLVLVAVAVAARHNDHRATVGRCQWQHETEGGGDRINGHTEQTQQRR